MIHNLFSQIFKPKKFNSILAIPPILVPDTFYTSTPILVGQLIANGFNAKTLDLNIKFFRKILTSNYIKKTKQLLDKKKINYNLDEYNFLANNIEKAVNSFSTVYMGQEGYSEVEKILTSALAFISSPYDNFLLDKLDGFDSCFKNFNLTYRKLKEISFDKNSNIFIPFFEEIVKNLKKEKIDFIGITIPFPATLVPAFTFARLLKEKTNIHVSIGGALISEDNIKPYPEIFDIFCDSVLVGDGEKSICELVNALEKKQTLDSVNGIIYKNKKNQIISTKPQPIVNYNDISNLSLEGIDITEYLKEKPSVHLMISKGCYWGKCNFCGIAEKYPRYCIQKVDQVISQIKEIQAKYPQVDWFLFQDDALHPNYLSKLADEIIKENLNIYYFVFARFEKEFTKELLEKLYKSGLRNIYWGLESGSQSVLDAMNKGVDINIVRDTLKTAYELGIGNMTGIIINFPTETMEEYNETVKFISSIKKYATVSPGDFAVMKHSVIAKEHEKYNIELLGFNDFSYCYSFNNKKVPYPLKCKKWNDFCEFVKNDGFEIDTNKDL